MKDYTETLTASERQRYLAKHRDHQEAEAKKSVLIPEIRGFLYWRRGFDHPFHHSARIQEAERIAAKIRDTFGRFDESDKHRCRTLISVTMKTAERDLKAGPVPDHIREREAQAFWEAQNAAS
jgi:hypothetical protein